MPNHSVHRHLAYGPEQMFNLVADVGRYPEFVPWWVAATVWKTEGNKYYTKQVIGLPLVRQEFKSMTELDRPGRITVTSTDRPFKNLLMLWTFGPAADGGCEIRLDVDFEFQSRRYSMLGGVISGEGIKRLVDAFEGRALQLYGQPVHAPVCKHVMGGGHHVSPAMPILGGHVEEPDDDHHHCLTQAGRQRPVRHVGLRSMAMHRPGGAIEAASGA